MSGGLYYFTQRLATATIQLGQHLFHSALKYVGGDLDECSDQRPVECRCYLITEIQYLCWGLATLGRQPCTSFCSRIHLSSSLIYILSVCTDSVIVTSCSDLLSVPVNIVNNPGSSTLLVGGSATFSCAANGTQRLTFMWYKDGEGAPLVAGGGVSISNRPSESSLTLTKEFHPQMLVNTTVWLPINLLLVRLLGIPLMQLSLCKVSIFHVIILCCLHIMYLVLEYNLIGQIIV